MSVRPAEEVARELVRGAFNGESIPQLLEADRRAVREAALWEAADTVTVQVSLSHIADVLRIKSAIEALIEK